MRKKISPNLSLTEHTLVVAHQKDYRRDFIKTKNEMKPVLKELVPSLWKWYFEGPGMPMIYCDYDRTRSDALSPFADLDEILNKFLSRWAIESPIVPHGARCCCNVETAWGPVYVVERILARFLEGFWPDIEKDNVLAYSVSVRRKVWNMTRFWNHYLDDQNLGSLPRHVSVVDQWARTISKIAPKPGPGRKRDAAREMTAEEKEQAREAVHAFLAAADGADAEVIMKSGEIVPNYCLGQVKTAFGPAQPLVFSFPIVKDGKVVGSVPIKLSSKGTQENFMANHLEAREEATEKLRQIGFDSAFVESFRRVGYRASLKACVESYRPITREELREAWAALWSDIAFFLYRRGKAVSSGIAAYIALSLWEDFGAPRPMTSRNKRGNTKTPTLGGLRKKFDDFATEYAPDAESLLQIVEEEKARHAKEQTAVSVKIKRQRR